MASPVKLTHPSNAETIFAAAYEGVADLLQETKHEGSLGRGGCIGAVIAAANYVSLAKHWVIEGLGARLVKGQ